MNAELQKTESAQNTTEYHEVKIGKTLYRVTSVYLGKIDLGKALEDLTVRKILRSENAPPQCQG